MDQKLIFDELYDLGYESVILKILNDPCFPIKYPKIREINKYIETLQEAYKIIEYISDTEKDNGCDFIVIEFNKLYKIEYLVEKDGFFLTSEYRDPNKKYYHPKKKSIMSEPSIYIIQYISFLEKKLMVYEFALYMVNFYLPKDISIIVMNYV